MPSGLFKASTGTKKYVHSHHGFMLRKRHVPQI